MKTFVFLLFSFIVNVSFSQRRAYIDSVNGYLDMGSTFFIVSGNPFNDTKFLKLVEGSPYYSDKWEKGIVVVSKKIYKNVTLKLNLIDQQLHFLDKNNKEFIINKDIEEISFFDSAKQKQILFRAIYPQVSDIKNNIFFQVLVDGRISLLKVDQKIMSEQRPYGASTLEQTIRDYCFYYFYKEDGGIIKVKLNKENILNALAEYKSIINKFIDKNNLNLKNEDHLIKLIEFINENSAK